MVPRYLLYMSISIIVPASLLAGCDQRGDFGRYEPSFLERNVLPVARSFINNDFGPAAYTYPLSADEEELRSQSFSLANPAQRSSLARTLRRYALSGRAQSAHERKRRIRHAAGSEPWRYKGINVTPQGLVWLVKDDIELTERFTKTVERVYGADRIRHRRLFRSGNLPGREIRKVSGRIRQNRKIVANTLVVLENRVADYRLDLQHLSLRRPHSLERTVAYAIETLEARRRTLVRQVAYWTRMRRRTASARH